MKSISTIYDYKKYLTLVLIIILSCLIGGIYGILHDQLTYTICPEYYTKFKFYQFRLLEKGDEVIFPNPRIQVSWVGFLATWWMGLPIGLVLGIVGLFHPNNRQMFYYTLRAILITIIVAFANGLLGLAYGRFVLAGTGVNWWLPENLNDTTGFIAVGSMHNFSYLGGLLGLIIGCVYSFRKRGQERVKNNVLQ